MDADDEPPRQLPAAIAYVYMRLADDMDRRIRAGEWPSGARLPGREDVAAEYGVSDQSVRSAWRVLEERGLVRVLPSKGVYVTWAGHKEGT
jgi:GntR family transcriptional regulator